MGDSETREFPVYIPPDYSAKRADPYPIIFILSGWGQKSAKYLTDESAFSPSLQSQLDLAMSSGLLAPAIIVFPAAHSKLGGSQYLNSSALGNYQDYIADELVELMDSRFHTHRAARYRAVMGHSSGGFGALHLGFDRPDRFSYVLSSAGDSHFELSLKPEAIPALNEVEKAGGIYSFMKKFFEAPSAGLLSQSTMMAMMTLSMAACYSPNPKVPHIFGDLFFDLKTGAILEDVWERYLRFDPVNAASRKSDSIKKLRHIWLESGREDEYALMWGHRQLGAVLETAGASYSLEEYSGRHSGQNWRMFERIKKILQKLSKC